MSLLTYEDARPWAAALKAKGYDYRFVFTKGTGHCDGKVFKQTLADTQARYPRADMTPYR